MTLNKTYSPAEMEPRLNAFWQEAGIYHFDPESSAPVYSIDTPPPTVSGHLHLGHVYSYSHADFMARFHRMQGENVYYPMGFDDNGLPTERLVEKRLGLRAAQIGRAAFIEQCRTVSEEAEQDYRKLWQRLGLSIDWRYTYRTIDVLARRTSQFSFVQLYQQGRVYREQAAALWCPECRTAIAQAELNDLERESEFINLPFKLDDGNVLVIATTRPELLAACVAVFVHPQDARYQAHVGQWVEVPLYGQRVPVLADVLADPAKGSGAVMCCTFGDQTDITWWQSWNLPMIEAIDRQGRMTQLTGDLAGLSIPQARKRVKDILAEQGLILARQSTLQSVRVHERCDTPVEHLVVPQWFVRILDERDELLSAGREVQWFPEHMHNRYQNWVEALSWDWCISRQRYFGVPFPLWYCADCGAVILADEGALPVDPLSQGPGKPCACGSPHLIPEEDVMDTWATSSLTPQIAGRWLTEPELFKKVFPFSLRPQAHEIIRTWAFYTITKSLAHNRSLPWKNVLISGWGLAGEGMGKISKSRGGGPMAPIEMIQRTSADALRYWAASTATGKDAVISEEKIQAGGRLVTKLWNVARFCEPFLTDQNSSQPALSPADRWILARLAEVIREATAGLQAYEYASAKAAVETFFWRDMADNYLEMAKQRLYDAAHPLRSGAQFTLRCVLNGVIKLLAPFLPYVTEAIYLELFAKAEGQNSIHRAQWPVAGAIDEEALAVGERLVSIATAVRRYKSEHNLALSTPLNRLQLAAESEQAAVLQAAGCDLSSVTRAGQVDVSAALEPGFIQLTEDIAIDL